MRCKAVQTWSLVSNFGVIESSNEVELLTSSKGCRVCAMYLRGSPQRLAQAASTLSTILSIAIDRVEGVVGVGGAFESAFALVDCC